MNLQTAAVAARKSVPQTLQLTSALAARNAAWHFLALPSDARELVRQCLLDWIAVAIAGAHEPLTRMLSEEAREQGGHPQSSVIGQGFATSCRQAALINGAASHARAKFSSVSGADRTKRVENSAGWKAVQIA